MQEQKENIVFGKLESFANTIDLVSYSEVLIVSGDNKYEIEAANTLSKSLSAVFSNSPKTMSIPSSESAKSLNIIEILWSMFAKFNIDRHSIVISVGGGSISDAVGFAASTYMRGIVYGCVPTTLLSCCDASIGGKRAINLPEAKNIVGSFWFASFIFVDVDLLSTLSSLQMRSGFAELLKTAFVVGGKLLEECKRAAAHITDSNLDDEGSCRICTDDLARLIKSCIEAKQSIVLSDPHDRGYDPSSKCGKSASKMPRAILNYGHTFGHAIESACRYSIPHGLCVCVGMDIVADYFDNEFGHDVANQQRQLMAAFGLDIDDICESVRMLAPSDNEGGGSIAVYLDHDKKSDGEQTSIVALDGFGKPKIFCKSAAELNKILLNYKKLC